MVLRLDLPKFMPVCSNSTKTLMTWWSCQIKYFHTLRPLSQPSPSCSENLCNMFMRLKNKTRIQAGLLETYGNCFHYSIPISILKHNYLSDSTKPDIEFTSESKTQGKKKKKRKVFKSINLKLIDLVL